MFTGSEGRRLRAISLGSAGCQPAAFGHLRARAFTLLEIMLAVIILGMMSLAI